MDHKIIAGNWKTGVSSRDEANNLIYDIVRDLGQDCLKASNGDQPALVDHCKFLVAPSAVHLDMVSQFVFERSPDGSMLVGAQNCIADPGKAHTGDLTIAQIDDLGAGFVILGHSERRADHGESSGDIRNKVLAVLDSETGIIPIVCVGETEEQRQAGQEFETVEQQILNSLPGEDDIEGKPVIVAYEPVWAIGTGLTASPQDVEEMHAYIRELVGADKPILYGGSMKPDNAAALLNTPNVDGGLIGGASLKAKDFLGIARNYVATLEVAPEAVLGCEDGQS